MKQIYQLHFKLNQYIQNGKNIYTSAFIMILMIASFAVSTVTTNHILETWSSVVAGFTFGLLLITLPAIIKQVKQRRQPR